jgi:nucleoside-diphosphate-sugar epimerase
VQQSIADPEGTRHVNVDGTMNVLEACRKYGSRFILASSAAVYGSQPAPHVETMEPQPLSPYAEHKLAGERAIADYRLQHGTLASALRCFNVYGPRQRPDSEYSGVIGKFASRLAAGQPVTVYGDGEQTRDFVFVADVVQAYVRAATVDLDGPVNIGTGSSVSVNQLLVTLAQVMGVSVEPQHGPAVAEVRHSLADVARARELLGWQVRTSLADGLAQTVASFGP